VTLFSKTKKWRNQTIASLGEPEGGKVILTKPEKGKGGNESSWNQKGLKMEESAYRLDQ